MATVTANAHKKFGRPFTNETGLVKLTYDFAQDGGATTDTYKLGTVEGKIMIKNAIVQVETACTSGGSAVVTLGAVTADADGFLDATSGAVANLVDDFTVEESTSVGLVVGDADTINLDIATAALTAGKINVYIWYVSAD